MDYVDPTQYRKSTQFDIELTNGLKFLCKKAGRRVYDVLMASVDPEKFKDVNMEEISEEEVQELFGGNMEDMAIFMDVMVTDMVLKPKIVMEETEDPGSLWIHDLEYLDGMELFYQLMKKVEVDEERLAKLFQ